ncbi:MAG: hypothetical protein NC820_07415, partial [Candidatus Omnitrophica bacterium]|nr:hypothetical protein [Candidatus Omnitrophota bacterium]
NTYKENKSPWQLAKEKQPDIPKEALILPLVDLDALLNKKLSLLTKRGIIFLLSTKFLDC